MENKLLSMVDFTLYIWNYAGYSDEEKLLKLAKYAEFLKSPLELGQFVPTDENRNVLKEPSHYDLYLLGLAPDDYQIYECGIYEECQSRVLFEGFEVKRHFPKENPVYSLEDKNGNQITFHIGLYTFGSKDGNFVRTIEDLVKYNLTLTNNALKIWE